MDGLVGWLCRTRNHDQWCVVLCSDAKAAPDPYLCMLFSGFPWSEDVGLMPARRWACSTLYIYVCMHVPCSKHTCMHQVPSRVTPENQNMMRLACPRLPSCLPGCRVREMKRRIQSQDGLVDAFMWLATATELMFPCSPPTCWWTGLGRIVHEAW